MAKSAPTGAPQLRWTLVRKISAVPAGVEVGLVVIGATSYASVGRMDAGAGRVSHTYQVLTQVAAM